MTAPCKDCGLRRIGCHAVCAAYAEYDAANVAARTARAAVNDVNSVRDGVPFTAAHGNKLKRNAKWR